MTINNEMFVNNNITTVGDNIFLGSISVSEASTLNDDVMIGGSLDVINDVTINNNISIGNELTVNNTKLFK
jgi:carbonic anhydrase/acetyltransferase-like protein (isoleucine patch superfamily)